MTVVLDIVVMALLIGGLIAAQRTSAGHDRANDATANARDGGDRLGSSADGRQAQKSRPTPAQLAPLAAGLSFLIPGAGHLLIRAPARGLIWLVGWIAIGALSGASHSPVVLVLMVVAAVDAYLTARSQPAPPGPTVGGRTGEGDGR